MKRDMELIRLLLLEQEQGERPDGLDAYSDEDMLYNYKLMADHNLIEATFSPDYGVPDSAMIHRLTWEGHDFLDATKNSEIWKLAKEHIVKPGVSWTFQILMEWLKREAQQRFLGGQTSSCDIS